MRIRPFPHRVHRIEKFGLPKNCLLEGRFYVSLLFLAAPLPMIDIFIPYIRTSAQNAEKERDKKFPRETEPERKEISP